VPLACKQTSVRGSRRSRTCAFPFWVSRRVAQRLRTFSTFFGVCLVFLAAAHTASAAPTTTSLWEEPPLTEVVASVDRSLVHILAGPVSGSGFVFAEPKWVLTNRHVVKQVGIGGTARIRPVSISNSGKSTLGVGVDGIVRAMHPNFDLAVIEVTSPLSARIQPIAAVPSDSLLPRGTEVLIHGFPATSVPTVSRGIVSGHHHNFSDDEPVYLLDAASGSGSSGGPVTDRAGNLVAVASAVYDTEASKELGFAWCFAIPVSHVRNMFNEDGGLKSAQLTETVDDLARQVLNAERGSQRVEALRSAFETIRRTRSSLLALASDNLTLLERVSAALTLDSESLGRQFMEALLDQGNANAMRAAELALGGDESLEDSVKVEQLIARMQALGREIMAQSLAGLDERRQGEVLIGVLDAMALRAEALRNGLATAVKRLEPAIAADPQSLRGTERDSFLSALSEIFRLQAILELTSRLPTPSKAELQSLAPGVRSAFRRFQTAANELRESWEAAPEAVRLLVSQPVSHTPPSETVRNKLQ
jgi:S1-C subfamily serine protease